MYTLENYIPTMEKLLDLAQKNVSGEAAKLEHRFNEMILEVLTKVTVIEPDSCGNYSVSESLALPRGAASERFRECVLGNTPCGDRISQSISNDFGRIELSIYWSDDFENEINVEAKFTVNSILKK